MTPWKAGGWTVKIDLFAWSGPIFLFSFKSACSYVHFLLGLGKKREEKREKKIYSIDHTPYKCTATTTILFLFNPFSIQFYPILSSWFCLLYNVLRASPTLDDLGKPRDLRLRHCTLFPLPTIYESGKERVVARDCAIRHEFLLLQSLRIHGWLYPVKFYHSNLSIKSLEPFHFVSALYFLVHRPCWMCRHTFIGNHTTTYHHTPLATGLDMSRKRYTHLLFFFLVSILPVSCCIDRVLLLYQIYRVDV